MPNPEQEVAANIGIILMEVDAKGEPFADVALTLDWRLVRVIDPSGDLDYFYELANRIREQIRSLENVCSSGGMEMSERAWILHAIEDSFSNSIQVSEPKALLTDDPEAALKKLVRTHCKLPDPARDLERKGVTLIKRSIRDAFEHYEIGPSLLTKNFKIARYVESADPTPIHYKYEVEANAAVDLYGISLEYGKVFRLIQAVSLQNGIDGARTLGYAWPEIREGIAKKEKAYGHLTAVVEDSVGPNHKNMEFAQKHFAEHGVVLRHIYQLDDMARTARAELKL